MTAAMLVELMEAAARALDARRGLRIRGRARERGARGVLNRKGRRRCPPRLRCGNGIGVLDVAW